MSDSKEALQAEEHTTAMVVSDDSPIQNWTPRNLLEQIDLDDYKQFLYSYESRGQTVTDLSAEGVKTLALQFGISTGDVEIDFLDDMRTEALFTCTATNMQTGQTATVNIYQEKREFGRSNRYWIEKGTTRVIRNAQKALLPVGLLKTALEKAIIASEGMPPAGDIDEYDESEYLSS